MPMTLRGLGLLATLSTSAALAAPGYYREPSLSSERVVFTAEGDLWSVPRSGGQATRLTTHPAEELHAALSPDGQQVAFTASYLGTAEAWVMPVTGGQPRQVSFEGQRASVLGWSPAGEVLYGIQAMPGPHWAREVVAVHPDSGARRVLPLAGANEAAIGADGTVYFTRGGLHLTNDNARLYRGGLMARLWRWREGEAEATPLFADLAANARSPMLADGRLYFVSDADGWDNLWSAALDGSDRRQHTRHRDFGVRGAASGPDGVVYQHGADLRVYTLAGGDDQPLAIGLVSDFDQTRPRWHKRPTRFLTDADLSADGGRVAVVARGRLALAGLGALRRVEIRLPGDARVFATALAADGQSVFAITDQSGEQEIWRFPVDGSPDGTRLTRDGGAHRWDLYPSPDGRWLAHHDKRGRLFLLDLKSNTNTLIDERAGDFHADINWSADSKALAFARPDSSRLMQQVMVYDLSDRRVHVLTSDKYNSGSPRFSPDGKWLYFLSDRHFESWPTAPWGDRNLGPAFNRRTKVYALALQEGLRLPFRARDELLAAGAAPAAKPDAAPPAIQFTGLAARLHEVPVAPGEYDALAVDGARLYLLDREPRRNAKPVLKTLAISDEAPTLEVFLADVQAVQVSADRKQVLIVKAGEGGPGDLLVVPAGAKPPADLAKATVRLSDWQLELDPRAEWRQMFVDAWRMHREFLYASDMRGVDWPAMRARYAPLVERVTAREELNDVLAQLLAEVGSLHSQIVPGELRGAEDGAAVGMLGARLEPVAEGWRIAQIFMSDPELPSERGPLAAPGVDAAVGDIITHINGVSTRDRPPQLALQNQAGQQVLLSLRRGKAVRRAVVVPVNIGRHYDLAQGEWQRANLARVQAASAGRIGYLHLKAMTGDDINDFAREFYAHIHREGLIIDVRNNRGGNIDSWVIEKLLRRGWEFWQGPQGDPYWNMQQPFRGHLVVLANEHTYSSGETFSMAIKSLGLAPIIGQRTAGAGVWLTARNNLRDGGRARAAEFGQFDSEGHWLIEGRGLTPDIEVANLPRASFDGRDAQLEAAIAHLQARLAAEPVRPAVARPIGPLGSHGQDPAPLPPRR